MKKQVNVMRDGALFVIKSWLAPTASESLGYESYECQGPWFINL
jgi:hypothetical protein